VLCKLDASGAVIGSRRPVGTSIVQLLPLGQRVLVREDYYQFPRGSSNVYCLDADFQQIWSAELPDQSDVYVRIDSGPSCSSWNGFYCTIDPDTGRIIKKEFTK
jgi:outer membrane protein assembly factor BamB